MILRLVKNENKYWEFIRQLRTDEINQKGFVTQVQITTDQQIEYMKENGDRYYICLLHLDGIDIELPVGFVGIVDNDLRIAVKPEFHNKGIGKFMMFQLTQEVNLKNVIVKVKLDNEISQKLFLSSGFTEINNDDIFKYYKI